MVDNLPDEKTLLDKLIEVTTFGLDDLELNRQGKMSGLQRSRLAFMTIFYFGASALSFAFGVGTIGMLFQQSQIGLFPVVLLWVIFCTFMGLYWLYQAIPMWKDVQLGTVLCVSGPLHKIYTRANGRAPVYSLHYRIAKKFFNIALFAPKLIPQDQKCHAYYTPQSEILVGLEPT
jgi:hypothetical protein